MSFFGRRGRDRTYDPRFWRPVLYQLSYAPRGYTYPNVMWVLKK